MRVFGIEPCNTIGQLKDRIKDAILDGVIPNEHDAAFDFMMSIAHEYGLRREDM